ncbi:hypothetical protein ABW21_db0207300 [Orbilia brochopaga]|nr:hypothetical protein ABW21_db0207300 [Drechslerella brochopaga]
MAFHNRQSLTGSIFDTKAPRLSLFAPASNVFPTPPSSTSAHSSSPLKPSTSRLGTDTSVSYSSSADFFNALTAAYNAAKQNSSGYIWCPIFKQYLPPELIKPIHIIPTYTDPGPIGYLFGNEQEGSSHIHSLSNGLVLAKCVADLFECSDFAIIPASTEAANNLDHPTLYGRQMDEQTSRRRLQKEPKSQWQVTTDADGMHTIISAGIDISAVNNIQNTQNEGIKLKLVLMKPWMAKSKIKGMAITYGDLHNTMLEFKSPFRPDIKYLYFHYVTSMLRWLNVQEAALYKDAWRPKEKWLRESLIVELARPGRLGNWEVYEEILAGRGMFDDSNERDGADWIVSSQFNAELETSKLENMAMRLSYCLLVLSE